MVKKGIEGQEIWTVGHSTRSMDDFGRLLLAHDIKNLVDVRSYPGSRRYPQFNREALSESLAVFDVRYIHMSSLGGRRKPRADSHNTAWDNESFRAYADHMETEEFKLGVRELLELSEGGRTTVMCAEALWWRCHRSLIADYLKSIDVTVTHIIDLKKSELHPYTSAARIVNGSLTYRGLLDSEG